MAENLYDSSELIELIKSGQQPEGYTTILNLIEFPKGVTLVKLKLCSMRNRDSSRFIIEF